MLGPERVRAGDVVIAMGSSGLHSNGYSLARHVFFSSARLGLDGTSTELGRTLGEELLEPTRIYALDCLALAQPAVDVHASATSPAAGWRQPGPRAPGASVGHHRTDRRGRPQPVFS